jgi:hypothetical protein
MKNEKKYKINEMIGNIFKRIEIQIINKKYENTLHKMKEKRNIEIEFSRIFKSISTLGLMPFSLIFQTK